LGDRNPESGIRYSDKAQLDLFQKSNKKEGTQLTLEKILALWNTSFIVDTYKSRVEADFNRKKGKKLMEEYFDWWSRKLREVVSIEKSFKVDLGGFELSGRIDRIERAGFRIPDSESSL